MPHSTHGTVVLMGSGEMAPSMVEVHKYAMSLVEGPVRAAFINTPAGFQLNAGLLAEKAAEYFEQRLNTPLTICDFKNAGRATFEETQAAISTLHRATYIFAGPGSPTYAIHNWRHTPVLDAMFETLSHGGCLTFASAAALTLGRFTIPVYEIYKVGEPVHWVEGLNLLGHNEIEVAIVPHWNNNSGGDHDTRFCFMGEPRWEMLERLLPSTTTVLGIDEHTACILRFDHHVCEVRGIGQVTVQRGGLVQVFNSGSSFSLDLLRSPDHDDRQVAVLAPRAEEAPAWETIRAKYENLLTASYPPRETVAAYIYDLMTLLSMAREQREWQTMQQAEDALREALVNLLARLEAVPVNVDTIVAPYVDLLLQVRSDLRSAKQWTQADLIRDRLNEIGILIQDSPSGSVWQRRTAIEAQQ